MKTWTLASTAAFSPHRTSVWTPVRLIWVFMPDVGVDAGVVVNEVTVSGQVIELGQYLAGNTNPVGPATLFAYGVENTPQVTVQANGQYSIILPANGQAVLGVAGAAGYSQSYYGVTTTDQPYPNRTLYAALGTWLGAIADYHNVNIAGNFDCQTVSLVGQSCLYAAVVGRIYDDGVAGGGNGVIRPVAGIEADDFTIYGPDRAPWYVRGPYFLDYDATPDEVGGGTTSIVNPADYRGGLYIVFVEVPVGSVATAFEVQVAYQPQVGPTRYFGPNNVQAFTGLGTVRLTDLYEALAPPPPPVNGVDFDTQIYPLFLPIAEGGFGCVGCHTNQGGNNPSGGMNLYGGPTEAYASLNPLNYPQRVNTGNVGASYLLVRPLYEANGIQDHPIFAFASPQDPGYQLIYTWISEGGTRNLDNVPASFVNDVRPLLYNNTDEGGAGCYACHVNGADEDDAPGGLYMGGECDELHFALTQYNRGDVDQPYRVDRDDTAQSLVLTNATFGNPEPHQVKIFSGAADQRYQLIYSWIEGGYLNDCPQ